MKKHTAAMSTLPRTKTGHNVLSKTTAKLRAIRRSQSLMQSYLETIERLKMFQASPE